MNFIKLTTFILLLPLSSFSQSKNLEINDFFDFKITKYFYQLDNSNFNSTDSTFTVPEGKLWKINYFGIGFRQNIFDASSIGITYYNDHAVQLDGAIIYSRGGTYLNAISTYEKKCPIWLNSGEHTISIDHNYGNNVYWKMELNLSIVEFNITEN